MKRSITKNLSGVNFHDSRIVGFERAGDTVTLTFDWAGVAYENAVRVVGLCHLHLFQIVSEEVFPSDHSTECMGREYKLVGDNNSESDNDLILGGFFESATKHSWVEWRCKFESFKLEWYSDVTLEEWRSGKLPNSDQAAS